VRFEKFTAKDGTFRFRLVGENGRIIVSSHPYDTRAKRDNGIELLRECYNAPVKGEKPKGIPWRSR
jgi:uncharacterized protein YegP (UPF0339 family)